MRPALVLRVLNTSTRHFVFVLFASGPIHAVHNNQRFPCSRSRVIFQGPLWSCLELDSSFWRATECALLAWKIHGRQSESRSFTCRHCDPYWPVENLSSTD